MNAFHRRLAEMKTNDTFPSASSFSLCNCCTSRQSCNEAVIKLEKGVLLNRTELWKLVKKGPGLEPVQLLATLKRRLERETAVHDFDSLAFQIGCAVLVQKLIAIFEPDLQLRYTGDKSYGQSIVAFNLLLLLVIMTRQDCPRAKLKEAARAFEEWLAQYGNLGTKKMRRQEQQTIPRTSIEPRTVSMVQDIVKRRDLLEGVFTPDQLSQMGDIKATGRLEDQIREAWQAHRQKRG